MNEELLIQLLEPFQIERFIKQMELLSIEEKRSVATDLKQQFRIFYEFNDSDIEEFELNGLSFMGRMVKNQPIYKALFNYLDSKGWKVSFTQDPKFNHPDIYSTHLQQIQEGEDYEIYLFEAHKYYRDSLIPLTEEYLKKSNDPEEIKKYYLSKLEKPIKQIEPLKWNGSKRQFAALLYELIEDPKGKGRLLGEGRETEKNYAEILKHFVFKDKKTGEYKPETGTRMTKYVSDIRLGYGSEGSEEEYEWIRDID